MISINDHEIVLDKNERLEAWISYGQVVKLAMDFIKNCPKDTSNGLPWFMQYSCFWIDPVRPTIWPDNPAGKFAWAVTTLQKYYPYSGDESFIALVRSMLERLWQYRTPLDYSWGGIPYASADPGTAVYGGARADGKYVTEPDKVAQVGKAYLDFYQITGEDQFMQMGLHCAKVLSEKLRSGDQYHSPLPFRVDVRDGRVIEEYTAHMIAVVRLFDETIRLGHEDFQPSRDQVWEWIRKYPLTNNVWKGYFEDIRLDVENENRDQVSPLETARYILENKNLVQDWKTTVKNLIEWVKDTLGAPPFFSAIPIHEQKFCYFVMGSHTARFACLCALYAEHSGEENYREMALRSFNWATYMTNKDGTVTVGIDRPDYFNQCWFTDGYFDYVPHFIDGMAALPEKAPTNEDHLLRSTSIIQKIYYDDKHITYRTNSEMGVQRFRLSFEPKQILADKKEIRKTDVLENQPGWMLVDIPYVVDIKPIAKEVEIFG